MYKALHFLRVWGLLYNNMRIFYCSGQMKLKKKDNSAKNIKLKNNIVRLCVGFVVDLQNTN